MARDAGSRIEAAELARRSNRIVADFANRAGFPSPIAATPSPAPLKLSAFQKEYEEYSRSRKRPKSHATDVGCLSDFQRYRRGEHVEDLSAVTTSHVNQFLTKNPNIGAACHPRPK